MKINLILLSAFLSFIFFQIGCDDTATGIDEKNIPDSNVSFSAHIAPVLEAKCAFSGCHDDATRAAGISLLTWSGATTPGLLIPGEPENSRLVWVIEGIPGFTPMAHIGTPALTADQINGVKTWIDEGAENN